jgi:hypothetical protein
LAFASVGSIGSVQSKSANQSSLVLTTNATLNADNLGVLIVAVDNNATADGDEGAVSGVVDSAGNTWTKGHEYTYAELAAQAGATCSVWFKRVTSELASSGTITISFTNNTSRDASAATAWEFTAGAGTTISVEATNQLVGDTTVPGSLNATTSNIECLRVRGLALENTAADTVLVVTDGTWTKFTDNATTGGSAASNMGVCGEFKISTGTGAASDPATSTDKNMDHVGVYVALKEVAAGTNLSPGQGNLTLSTTAPTAARTDHHFRTPATGNLTLSTTAPTASQNINRNPASANLVLSTTAPTVAQTTSENKSPAAANLVLSTTAPSLAQTTSENKSPATANLVLSATAPTVTQNINRNPAAANLVLSTTAPTRQVSGENSFNLSPATANLVLSTTAPSLVQTTNENKSPAAANLALSTTAPTAARTTSENKSPAAANLVLSTIAPSLVQTTSENKSPAAANLVLSTTAPTVEVGSAAVKTPATAQLTLSTTAPTLVVSDNRNLAPASANLTLSTTAPTLAVSSTGECIPLFQPNVFQNNVFQVCVEEEGGQKDGDPDYWRLPWFHVEGESAAAKATAELRDKVFADLERAFGLAESGTPAKAKKAARKAAKEIKALAKTAGALLSDDAIDALGRAAEELRYSASQWSRAELMARSDAARMALLAIEAEMHDEEEALLVLMLAA